jgi:hypothetical protein
MRSSTTVTALAHPPSQQFRRQGNASAKMIAKAGTCRME